MTDLEPVEPDAVLPRGARSDLPPQRWSTAGWSRRRTIVASGIRALAGRGPVRAVSALAVTAVVAAEVAGLAARTAGWNRAPVGPEAVGRIPGAPAADVTLQISWTHVEVRWRW